MKLIEPLGYVRETGLNNFDFTTWNMLDRPGWEPVYVLSEEQRNWLARLNRSQFKVDLIDAAILVNLLRQEGKHPDHIRIADDLTNQMLGVNNAVNGSSERSDSTTR